MTTLSTKIDFMVIVTVQHANPNGDPLNGNRPRVTYDGFGEMSDVSIKRKIRNRLMEMEHPIFVQSDDNRVDSYRSLRERADATLKDVDTSDKKKYQAAACTAWLDVRAFGQVFAFKAKKGKKSEGEEDSEGVSIPVRGPVSIHPAFSVVPVLERVSSIQITKSVSSETSETDKRGSDTMGMKHRVDHGVYVFFGSINPQLASKTGFSDEDADAIKEALRTLFRNDESSARPAGSMTVHKVYWCKHNSPNGQYPSAKVHDCLKIKVKDGVEEPKSIEDYDITFNILDGLGYEEIEGE
ncbi:MAG: type I-C CRISPR-associated protein Cas7/Csd2 [Chloroflexota bacterium]